jgi:diketogulonate reductase-like aldo/keto reductase
LLLVFIPLLYYSTSKKKLSDPINQENRTGSYKALEQLYKEGKVKHIGISNYSTKHLTHLLETCEIIPHVHQFEIHPCLYQPDLVELCKKNNIQIQAYSSLGEGKLINGEINIAGLQDIANKVKESCALVLLRWAIQHEWIIIPKSKTTSRIKENAKVLSFELSKEVSSLYQFDKEKSDAKTLNL